MRDEKLKESPRRSDFYPSSLITHPSKILLISYEYPPLGGGTGKAAMNTARELRRMGYEVAVLTSKFQNQPAEETIDGIRIFRIRVLRRHLNYANAIEVLSFAVAGLFANGKILKEFRPD